MNESILERRERIALDMAKYILENAQSDGNAPTKYEILQTYVECYQTITDVEVPLTARS